MRFAGILVLVVLIVAVFISGCIQQAGPSGTGELTEQQMEEQAYNALEQEMEQALENMTLEELENELLQQG